MKEKNRELLRKLELVKDGEVKEKTPFELFKEADETFDTLMDLVEEAREAWEDAKENLFADEERKRKKEEKGEKST